MKVMCKTITPYICKKCGEEMLFFVTGNPNYIIDYKNLFFKEQTSDRIYNIASENDVSYIKCLVCNKKYIIDWSNKFPEQMTNRKDISKFMTIGK